MIRKCFLLAAGLLLIGRMANAQDVKGKVVDTAQAPIEAVTVVMQTLDSTFVDAVITDPDGLFTLKQHPDQYRLIFQHLLYHTQTKECSGADAGITILQEQDYALDEVVIKGERPQVKVENGALVYDMTALAEKSVVSNAYESILRLPGVMEQGESVSLAGAGGVTVILNGKPSSMTNEQLINLLKNTPVSNVAKAEVMYNAPAKYRVRGAVINLVLRNTKSEDPFVRGEVGTEYMQAHYANGSGHANLSFVGKKLSADILYSAEYQKRTIDNDIISHHKIGDKVYDIEQYNKGERKGLTHNMRVALDYQLSESDNLNMAYTSAISPDRKALEKSSGNFSESVNNKVGDEQMHNVNLDYTSGWGLNAGIDYTYYNYPTTQDYTNKTENSDQQFLADASQTINRWNVYAGQTHTLPGDWSLNYGINFTFAKDKSSQVYRPQDGSDMSSLNTYTDLKEKTYNFYGGVEKSLGDNLSLSLSVAGEYYKLMDYKKWAVYPTMQLSYALSGEHIFQLGFSSDKTYPEYWTIQESVSYLNGYTMLLGNPALRPSTDYTAELTYVLKSKYMFNVYYSYVKDLFNQLAYQSPDKLSLIYQSVNYDYEVNYGATATIPFSVGSFWNSQLTLDGSIFKDVCDSFHDLSFNRTKFRGLAMMNNSFRLSSEPDIRLELNGMYVSSFIQGIYDVSAIWKIDAGLKWTFANKKAELRLKANDLFDSFNPDTRINYKGQNLVMNQRRDSRNVSLSFVYKFGGYKAKEHKQVDTSRFGF